MAASPIAELVRQCVLNELGAMMLYTRLADRLKSSEARLLRMLAAAEERHIAKLTELVRQLGDEGDRALADVGFVNVLREEAGRRLDEQMADLGLRDDTNVSELLRFAIETEARTGDQYENAAAAASDPRVRDFFHTLVVEEASHSDQLRNIQKLLEAGGSA